ncbi:hypothetical protein NMY22_g17528 [Coprinellus aureogranulatus]|nr:hypothetical protein NMY22_g17528 [Coprinellus aureogranulatus]
MRASLLRRRGQRPLGSRPRGTQTSPSQAYPTPSPHPYAKLQPPALDARAPSSSSSNRGSAYASLPILDSSQPLYAPSTVDPSLSASKEAREEIVKQPNDVSKEVGGATLIEKFTPKTKDFGFLPIPPHLRYHPDKPFHFGLGLNVAFGFASTFSASRLCLLPCFHR